MRIGITLVLFCFLVVCSSKKNNVALTNPHFRIINNTTEHLSNVALFSLTFNDLKPKDTSAYKILNFNPLTDDSLIYCTVGSINYARYVEIPDKDVRRISYVIDSIKNKILYVSTLK